MRLNKDFYLKLNSEVLSPLEDKMRKLSKEISLIINDYNNFLEKEHVSIKRLPKNYFRAAVKTTVPHKLIPKEITLQLIKNEKLRKCLSKVSNIETKINNTILSLELSLTSPLNLPDFCFSGGKYSDSVQMILFPNSAHDKLRELIEKSVKYIEIRTSLQDAEISCKSLKSLESKLIGISELAPKLFQQMKSNNNNLPIIKVNIKGLADEF